MKNRIEITVSDDVLAELDRQRGLIPRAAFIKDLLGNALRLQITRRPASPQSNPERPRKRKREG